MKTKDKIKELGQLQLLLIGVLILLFVVPYTYNSIFSTKFSSEEWKAEIYSESEWSKKWEMCKDLLKEYELAGMTSKEIINLLGQPNTMTHNSISYNLGPTGKGINYGTLTLVLDEDIVKEIKVTQG